MNNKILHKNTKIEFIQYFIKQSNLKKFAFIIEIIIQHLDDGSIYYTITLTLSLSLYMVIPTFKG